MSHETSENTPPRALPHMSFGDNVSNPPPLKCHVLFEWPLTAKFIIDANPFSLFANFSLHKNLSTNAHHFSNENLGKRTNKFANNVFVTIMPIIAF